MDYWGVVKGAWHITRRTGALWWLGVISAAQVGVYAVIVVALAAPASILSQLVSAPRPSDSALEAHTELVRERLLVETAAWLVANQTALLLGLITVGVVWIVVGVFDVASQTGVITQAFSVAEKHAASARAGLEDGFRLWWRAAGLLALAALPGLISLLIMSFAMLATVSWPLLHGRLPQVGSTMTVDLMLAPLVGLVSIVGIPMGVLVALGMRFAIIDDLEWRVAFRAAWKMALHKLVEVALMYVTITAVVTGATLAFWVGIAIVTGGPSFAVLAAAATTGGRGVGTAGSAALLGSAVLGAMLLLAFQSIMVVWTSTAWTLFWRITTGRVERDVPLELHNSGQQSGYIPATAPTPPTEWTRPLPPSEGGP